MNQTEQMAKPLPCMTCKELKTPDQFAIERRTRRGRNLHCRDCAREYYATYSEKHRERQRPIKAAAANRRYKADPSRYHAYINEYRRITKFGLSTEDVFAKIAQQGGGCSICGYPLKSVSRVAGEIWACIDHDHETGMVRGILCNRCNGGMGLFCDDPDVLRKAADYIDMHRDKE